MNLLSLSRRLCAYTAQCAIYVAVQLATLLTLFFLGVGPPLLVYEFFPLVSASLSDLVAYRQDSHLATTILGPVGDAAFLAVVGTLGLAPYLFTRSVDTIPRSLLAIAIALREAIGSPWWPRHPRSCLVSAADFARERAMKVARTARASIVLMTSFAALACAVMLAKTLIHDVRGTIPKTVLIERRDGEVTSVRRYTGDLHITVDNANSIMVVGKKTSAGALVELDYTLVVPPNPASNQ